jgi:DNA-binding NarL/FixJ family response regulator
MVVDDQVLLKEALLFMLSQDSEIEVIDGGVNGYEAIDQCEKYRPDVIIMDVRMPSLGGIEAAIKIKPAFPSVKILILTTFEDEESIFKSVNVGVDGFIIKDIKPEALVLAVKSVYNDLFVVHQNVAAAINENITKLYSTKSTRKTAIKGFNLSSIEIEIIELLADGLNNKEIGDTLGFTEGTVKNKISKLLGKLDLKDRLQLVIFGIKNNLI